MPHCNTGQEEEGDAPHLRWKFVQLTTSSNIHKSVLRGSNSLRYLSGNTGHGDGLRRLVEPGMLNNRPTLWLAPNHYGYQAERDVWDE